jgi:hypothetical protein
MVWFGLGIISLLFIWIAIICIEDDKNNKYLSEQNTEERRIEVKYTEEKHKKTKIKL